MTPPRLAAGLISATGSGLISAIGFGRAPAGARTIAIRTSSEIPLYFSSARTEGNVSKLHDEVFIFSMMRLAGSFAFTIVRMSPFERVVKPSWPRASGTNETERTRTRRTDTRDLGMRDPFKVGW